MNELTGASTRAQQGREREVGRRWGNTQRERQKQDHIAGNKHRNNAPLCITYTLQLFVHCCLDITHHSQRGCVEHLKKV